MVSSILGSSTKIGAKRRSNAASFSIYLWYSSKVVAPIHCKSPRAKAGLSMLEASIAPWAAPAPTTVCSSSMNKMISPLDCSISSIQAFRRSSNSPRKRVPAIIDPRSNETTLRFSRISGTSLLVIFCAKPSTIAVFPTPASPMRTGLFFVRRQRIWIKRVISTSRP